MTTPKCQRCERKSPNGFLCPYCTRKLADTLRELPWWLDRLLESAVGQVRLGDGGKRAHDPGLVKYTGHHGVEHLADDLAAGEITAAKLAATGRANAAASTLYRQAHGTLATWIRAICDARGVEYTRALAASANADAQTGVAEIDDTRGMSLEAYRAAIASLIPDACPTCSLTHAGEC